MFVAICNIKAKNSCKTYMSPYNENIRLKNLLGIENKSLLYSFGGQVFRSRDMGRAVAVRRWTPTALECYKRGCNCEGCFYSDFFKGTSQKCQMKASVLELVRVIGTPNVELQQVIID